PKPRSRALRRFYCRQLRGVPWQIYPGEVRLLTGILRNHKADLLHIYFGHIAMHLVPLMRASPLPVVVPFHGADAGVDMDKPAYAARLREVFAASTLVLARSQSLCDALSELGCPADKIRLNRTGIPLENFPLIVREVPPEGGQWRLLQACRLIEKKGLPTTLRAFGAVLSRYPEAELVIAGEGPLLPRLRSLAAEQGLSSRVRFEGFADQPKLVELMGQAHLFLHPSRTGEDGNREGVPNAMLEAMATGLPVLATRHGGIPEALEQGVSGLMVEEDDWEGLAAGALQLMEAPDEYRAMAAAARIAIENNFSGEAQIAALESCYREAVELGAVRV
ncbi:MAG: glycosyltransferase, partial [Verrucomicrobiales bacterium]